MARPAEKCGHTIICPPNPIRHNSPLDMPRAGLSEKRIFYYSRIDRRVRSLQKKSPEGCLPIGAFRLRLRAPSTWSRVVVLEGFQKGRAFVAAAARCSARKGSCALACGVRYHAEHSAASTWHSGCRETLLAQLASQPGRMRDARPPRKIENGLL